jgi:hypothetical protein
VDSESQMLDVSNLVQAYTTAHPGKEDWLGLATPDGRYEVALGEGCDGMTSDINVLADTSAEPWTLQHARGRSRAVHGARVALDGRHAVRSQR